MQFAAALQFLADLQSSAACCFIAQREPAGRQRVQELLPHTHVHGGALEAGVLQLQPLQILGPCAGSVLACSLLQHQEALVQVRIQFRQRAALGQRRQSVTQQGEPC